MTLNEKNDNFSPYSEYNQLIERSVWAGQLKQGTEVTEEVGEDVVRTEGDLSQEKCVGQGTGTGEEPGSSP